jgi:ribonuclease E
MGDQGSTIMKRMLFNATQPEELRVAIVDGQKLYDLDIETSARKQNKSNIYRGIITRVEPSLEAAFVNYGADRHGFLPLKDVARSLFRDSAPKSGRVNIRDALKEGQELTVQVEKEERGNKGAALTTFISLPGRYSVLMPNNPRAGGVSRRIEGTDRNDLRDAMSKLDIPEGMGLIIRTAGVGRQVEELQWDLDYLISLSKSIEEASQTKKAPFLVYQESNVVIRAIRDYLSSDIGEILIDNPEVLAEAQAFIQQVMPHNLKKAKLYDDTVPLFSRYQIESQIESAYQREVRLPSGGAIVIDHTEALVSIDINSARATKGQDIEETATNTNLEACDEIGRQLRLRDLGGLVVIDFIDMSASKNQRKVENRLREALKADRARVQIGRISRFGLMEMSRQRLRPSLGESSHIPCPRCDGQGTIRGVESLALSILRIIEEEALKDGTTRVIAQVPIEVATYLLNEKREMVQDMEDRLHIKATLVPNPNLQTPKYEVTRVRSDDATELEQRSYHIPLAEEGADPTTVTATQPAAPASEPVVRMATPSAPIPTPAKAPATQSGTPPKAVAKKPQTPSLIKRVLNVLLPSTKEPEAPDTKQDRAAAPAEQPQQRSSSRQGQEQASNRGGRGRGRSGQGQAQGQGRNQGQNRGQRQGQGQNRGQDQGQNRSGGNRRDGQQGRSTAGDGNREQRGNQQQRPQQKAQQSQAQQNRPPQNRPQQPKPEQGEQRGDEQRLQSGGPTPEARNGNDEANKRPSGGSSRRGRRGGRRRRGAGGAAGGEQGNAGIAANNSQQQPGQPDQESLSQDRPADARAPTQALVQDQTPASTQAPVPASTQAPTPTPDQAPAQASAPASVPASRHASTESQAPAQNQDQTQTQPPSQSTGQDQAQKQGKSQDRRQGQKRDQSRPDGQSRGPRPRRVWSQDQQSAEQRRPPAKPAESQPSPVHVDTDRPAGPASEQGATSSPAPTSAAAAMPSTELVAKPSSPAPKKPAPAPETPAGNEVISPSAGPAGKEPTPAKAASDTSTSVTDKPASKPASKTNEGQAANTDPAAPTAATSDAKAPSTAKIGTAESGEKKSQPTRRRSRTAAPKSAEEAERARGNDETTATDKPATAKPRKPAAKTSRSTAKPAAKKAATADDAGTRTSAGADTASSARKPKATTTKARKPSTTTRRAKPKPAADDAVAAADSKPKSRRKPAPRRRSKATIAETASTDSGTSEVKQEPTAKAAVKTSPPATSSAENAPTPAPVSPPAEQTKASTSESD